MNFLCLFWLLLSLLIFSIMRKHSIFSLPEKQFLNNRRIKCFLLKKMYYKMTAIAFFLTAKKMHI